MNRHINIPVFIPHLGCPNMCVFCNQRIISGELSFEEHMVSKIIDEALSTIDDTDDVEIAFFGGSFTGIDRSLMIRLLDTAQRYVYSGQVSGIRMSTRPDYISEEIIRILKSYSISAVELGIQSMSENVLLHAKRGHTPEDSIRAMRLLRDAGIETVGQLMIGLPGAFSEDEMKSAQMIVNGGCRAARIYPVIVLAGTELEEMYRSGVYMPLSVDEAAVRCAVVLDILEENNVKVIRIGLSDSENLHDSSTYVAGPNHPAMGELVRGEKYYIKMKALLEDYHGKVNGQGAVFYVSSGQVSAAVGQCGRNRDRILSEFNLKSIKICEKTGVLKYNILVDIG